MKTITSVSGGKTSAYIAANYPADSLVFALVRVEDPECKFPDEAVRQIVSDRIGCDFVGTAEEDKTVTAVLDLEQYLGKEITWVTGQTFEKLIKSKGGYLPNIMARFCTQELKIKPIFQWWLQDFGVAVKMNIGYRANEQGRAIRMLAQCNEEGLTPYKHSFEIHTSGAHKGKNKWENVFWRRPIFPLIKDSVFASDVQRFWAKKPVRFADHNNCVGCFHRNPVFLNRKAKDHPSKMGFFAKMEDQTQNRFRSDVSYRKIINYELQQELDFGDFGDCDSGFCGM